MTIAVSSNRRRIQFRTFEMPRISSGIVTTSCRAAAPPLAW
jgi:hypothetical protein